ncbi:hypothetical protein C9J85_13460 [Haloferax sp. wsp5]|nr:hypothetical protein C9J85_13460 [Haloferax sp. wsp5]
MAVIGRRPAPSDADRLRLTTWVKLDTLVKAAAVWPHRRSPNVCIRGAVLLPLLYSRRSTARYGAVTALFLDLVVWHVASIILGHGHTPFWSR